MSREYDIFYDAAGEGSWAEFREFGLATNGAQTVESYPKSYTTYGTAFGHSQDLAAGTVVVIRDSATTSGVNVIAYMEVVEDYVEAATSIILRPLCSKGDTLAPTMNSVIGHTFAAVSVIASRSTSYLGVGESAWAESSRLVIDLTEAPDEEYDYVVFGAGWINATINNPAAATAITGGTQTEVRARLHICQPDDIYADAGINTDDDVYTENVVTITKASTKQADLSTNWTDYSYELDGGECYNAQVGGIVTLQGGQRYDLSLQFCCAGNAPNTSTYIGHKIEVAQMHQARMIAFRYDASAATTFRTTATSTAAGAEQVADGHNENKLSTTGATTDYLTNSANPTSVSAMTVSVCLATSSYITADSDTSVKVSPYANDSSARTMTNITPRSATDKLATGAIRYDTFDDSATGNTTKVDFTNPKASGTTDVHYGFMITFVPLLLSTTADTQATSSERVQSINSTGWKDVDMDSSVSSKSMSAGYTTQTLYTSLRPSQSGTSTDVAWLRPRGFYLSDPSDPSTQVETTVPFGRTGYLGNNNSSSTNEKALATVFFERSFNEVAVTGRYLGGQVLNGDGAGGVGTATNDVGLNTPETTALYETPIADIPLDAATSVVAELLPGIGLKAWEKMSNPASGRIYKTKIAGSPEIKEVYRGLTKLTETSVSDTSDLGATDAWQYDSASGTLYLQLTTAYVPTASSAYIYAVTPIRVSLSTENIKIGGTYYPFEARMESLPGFTKTLSSSGGRFQNSVSLGKISLAAADGEFDNEFFDYIWQGRDANLWMGNSSVSDDLQDFKLIARSTMMIPSWSTSKIDIGLLDKKVDLTKAVHQSTVDWISGTLGATTTLKKQPVPVVYGNVERIPAYRVTTSGVDAGDNGAYQFAANKCSTISAIYYTADGTRSLAGGATGTSSVPESGQIAINNEVVAALGAPEGGSYSYDVKDVPDTIYVDVLGQCDDDGGSTPLGTRTITKNYFHLGEIGYDILTRTAPGQASAPVRTTDIDKASFDLIDSKKRHTFADTDSGAADASKQGYRETQEPVQVGLVIEADKTVAETFNSLCNGTFCYWKTNAAGRIAMDVADFYGGNLIVNGSAELPGSSASSTAIYPWKTLGTGTTIERKRVVIANDATRVPSFNGRYAIKLTSTAPIASGYAYQNVPLPKSGTYVLTLVGSTIDADVSGAQSDAQLSSRVYLPDGTYTDLSSATLPNPRRSGFSVGGDAAWARFSEEFEVEFGNAGISQVAFNCDWDSSGTSINSIVSLDMIQLFPVACVLTDENTIVSGMNFATENYYGYGVPFAARQAVNELGRKQSRVRTFVDIEAINGTFADTEFSEAKDLVESSGVAKLSNPILVGEDDADGVAAAGVTYYSRQRVNLSVKVLGLSRIPVIGEYVYMKSVSRVDSGPDEHPIWRIMSVAYDAKMPKTVSLKLEKPVDPVSDRMGTAYLT
jgi:hypothetical protein